MARVICVFCKTETDAIASAGYCDGCGRKLPTSAMMQTKKSMTRTLDEGPAEEKRAGGLGETLLLASVVHLVGGGLFLVVGPTVLPRVPENFLPRVMTWTLIPTLFVALLIPFAGRYPRACTTLALIGSLAWIGTTFVLDSAFALRWLLVQMLLLIVVAYAMKLAYRKAG